MCPKDPRGVVRGKCSRCDCPEYDYNEKSGKVSCFYCECPAPAHEKLDGNLTEQKKTESNPAPLENTVFFSITPRKGGGITAGVSTAPSHSSNKPLLFQVPHPSDVVQHSNVFVLQPQGDILNILNSKGSQEEIKSDDIPMPNVLTDSVTKALKNKKLLAKHRSSICRAVVRKLLEDGKASNDHLKVAAKKIKKTYSPMKRSSDLQDKALIRKLARARDRMLNGGSKKKEETSETPAPLSSREAQEAMVDDWAANKKSVTTMGAYLEATRVLRNKAAIKLKSLSLLVDFPALTIPQLLLKEFSAMGNVNIPLLEMKNNWYERLPYFRKYFIENNIFRIDDNFSDDQQTVIILENLHRIPLWLKTARPKRGQPAESSTQHNRACTVLEVFPENTPVAEARPAAKDPLRLSAIGDAMGCLNFFAIVDTEPIFNTEDPIEAMLLLLATYWVFHLNFGAANKFPILFLAACVLGPVKVTSYVSKNDKFLDLCRDHFNLEI